MEPALYPGDLIVYRKGCQLLDRGDLVVFEHGDVLVVHRVAALLRGGTLRTRGDANESVDSEPVAVDDIRGEVLLAVPAGRAVHALAAWRD